MSGRKLMSGLLIFCAIFGAALWYFQTRAYYREVSSVTEVFAYGDAFPVQDYQGIDADTSPLKMRACFTVAWDYWPSDEFAAIAEPLKAPGWFGCFDARTLKTDIDAGKASVILAGENDPFGFHRFIAQYEDGRAFMWRQINACGDAKFSGDTLPEGCEEP